MSLQEALAEYSGTLSRRQVSDNTRKAFWGDVNIFARFLAESSGDDAPSPLISTITAEHMQRVLAARGDAPGCAQPQVARAAADLAQGVFFAWLHETGKLGFDAAAGIAYRPFQDSLPEYLNEAEQRSGAARGAGRGGRVSGSIRCPGRPSPLCWTPASKKASVSSCCARTWIWTARTQPC